LRFRTDPRAATAPWEGGRRFSPGDHTLLRPVQGFIGFADTAQFVIDALSREFPGSRPFITRWHGPGDVRFFDAGASASESGAGTDREPESLASVPSLAVPLALSDGTHVGSLCALDRGYDPVLVQNSILAMARLLATAIEFEESRRTFQEAKDRLREEAGTDALTGLRNRGSFERTMRREWALSRRHRGGPASYLVVADVDELKPVNDRLGHRRGDALLVDVATALGASVRETDEIGRIGGDEFAAVLVRAGEKGYARFRDRFQIALARRRSGLHGPPSVSVGAVPLSALGSWEDALDAADQAMYDEKARRRG
jgi:diguanylate cyclase (GGDEF)-like protein